MDATEQRCREILAQEVEAADMLLMVAKYIRAGAKLSGWAAVALKAMIRIADATERQ